MAWPSPYDYFDAGTQLGGTTSADSGDYGALGQYDLGAAQWAQIDAEAAARGMTREQWYPIRQQTIDAEGAEAYRQWNEASNDRRKNFVGGMALAAGTAGLGLAGLAGTGTLGSAGAAGIDATGGLFGASGGAASGAIPGYTGAFGASGIPWAAPAGTAGVGGAAAGATGGAMASKIPSWIGNYLIPGVDAALGYKASGDAADAQSEAYDRALAENARQYDTSRADAMPWIQAGQKAVGQLSDPVNNFFASPQYGFVRDQGTKGIGNTWAARGGAFSGNAMKALNEFNTNLASGEYNNWFGNNLNLAGMGSDTARNQSVVGANSANVQGNYLANQGDTRASGVLSKYGAVSGGLNDIWQNFLYRPRP